MTLAPLGSIWIINAMINIHGVSSGTITQARLAILNATSSEALNQFSNAMWGFRTGPVNAWLIDGVTKGDIIAPSTNHNILSASGMYVCSNSSSNNGTVSLVLQINGTAGGTATTSNGFFYATRIA